jgi:hypothetical protein
MALTQKSAVNVVFGAMTFGKASERYQPGRFDDDQADEYIQRWSKPEYTTSTPLATSWTYSKSMVIMRSTLLEPMTRKVSGDAG